MHGDDEVDTYFRAVEKKYTQKSIEQMKKEQFFFSLTELR